MTERIIVLLDMDCFYVQVEERENPQIKGEPAAVVQYNSWKGGGIIAVNYEARASDVKRGMRGDEAKEKCPSIHLVQVPVQRGKADLTRYRNAGKEVISVLCQFSDCVERASIDEAYIDFTKIIEEKLLNTKKRRVLAEDLPSTWVVGYDEATDEIPSQTSRAVGLSCWLNETFETSTKEEQSNILRLSLAAEICEEMRRKVSEETGFKCSAGISHNKVLAKLACGLHKPNQQTVLPLKSVPQLWSHLPLGKVRNLGGKLGDSINTDLHCETMGDLSKLSLEKLRSKYDEKTSTWLFSLGRGIDNEAVTSRQLPKSIGCGKNFNGKEILNTKEKVSTWMKSLADELSERLLEDQSSNERISKTLTVHIRTDCEDKPMATRSCSLLSYKSEAITKTALGLIANANKASSKEEKWDPPIRNISLSAGKFKNLCVDGMTKINSIFKKLGPRSAAGQNDAGSPNSMGCGNGVKIISDESTFSKPTQNDNINPQKSFFLQFLSQNSSEKVKKKFFSEFKSTKNCNDVCHDIEASGNSNPSFDDSINPFDDNDNIHIDPATNIDPAANSNESIDTDANNDGDIDSDDAYNNSTDIDELNDASGTIEVIDISSEAPSPVPVPVLKSKRSRSPIIEILNVQSQNVASCSSRNHIADEATSDCVSVHDIFPDLDNVDWSVADLLPATLRKRVYEEVQKHKRLSGSDVDREISILPKKSRSSFILLDEELTQRTPKDSCHSPSSPEAPKLNNFPFSPLSCNKFTFCRECNRKVLTVNFTEHSDYHFATELRKQQIIEARASLGSSTRKRENIKNSPVKTTTRSKKRNKGIDHCMPKIEDYFKKK